MFWVALEISSLCSLATRPVSKVHFCYPCTRSFIRSFTCVHAWFSVSCFCNDFINTTVPQPVPRSLSCLAGLPRPPRNAIQLGAVSWQSCKWSTEKYVLPTYLYSLSSRNNLLGRITIIQARKSVCTEPKRLQIWSSTTSSSCC